MDDPPPHELFRQLKNGCAAVIPVRRGRRTLGSLRPVAWNDAQDAAALDRLATWHAGAFAQGGGPFPVTAEGVRHWLLERVLRQPHRALFWVCDARRRPVGHLGLCSVDGGTEVEQIDRVAAAAGGLMTAASHALGAWAEGAGLTPVGEAAAACADGSVGIA